MNKRTIERINEMVFMDRLNLFESPDVILYHPGHFPELNEQLLNYNNVSAAKLILIPDVYNHFLNCSEYDFYAPLLMDLGIEKERLIPIRVSAEAKGVGAVIQSAFNYLNDTPHTKILLAGKSFFSKRFYLLSSIYASEDKVLDILPLQDHREINRDKWIQSEKGRARVLNEIQQYAKIVSETISKKF